MRFGIWPSPGFSWEDTLALVSHCEETGWDTAYFADHFMPNTGDNSIVDGDMLECWSVLAALAATVPRIRLASLVTSITYRHPAVLANIASAVDRISRGRLTLGVGAGWQTNEHEAYGIELGSVSERLDRFEEACAVLVSLLGNTRTSFDGEYFKLADAPNQPVPVQEPLPLLIGGGGEKRTLRIAARFADEWNAWATPEVLAHKVEVLHRHGDDVGRDADAIHVSTQGMLYLSTDESWLQRHRDRDIGRPMLVGNPAEVTEIVARYRDAGAGELIVPTFNFGSLQRAEETCDLFIEQVAAHHR